MSINPDDGPAILPDHVRGDDFEISCQLEFTESGDPVPLTGWTLKSDLRDRRGNLVQRLTLRIDDAAQGAFSFFASAAEAENWPAKGPVFGDVETIDPSGRTQSTRPFMTNVLEDMTRNE